MPYEERIIDNGIIEHKHNCFDFWHPVDRVHLGTDKPLPNGHVLSIPKLIERNNENIIQVVNILVDSMSEEELRNMIADLYINVYQYNEYEFHEIVNKLKIESDEAGKRIIIGGIIL